MSNKTKESFNKALEELERARDEARVGLHLLSMEAKEKWNDLESKLREIDDEVRAKGETASETSAAKVHEFARTVREFVQKNVRNIR